MDPEIFLAHRKAHDAAGEGEEQENAHGQQDEHMKTIGEEVRGTTMLGRAAAALFA